MSSSLPLASLALLLGYAFVWSSLVVYQTVAASINQRAGHRFCVLPFTYYASPRLAY